METVTPISASISQGQRAPGSGPGSCGAARSVPREVEERLVDRQRLDQRRGRQHQPAHLLARTADISPCRADDDRLRAELQRLEHRHGRADAVDAGDVAGGRDDAAVAAADDDRLVAQAGVVALLDAGIEGVAVDMGDGEVGELGMGDQAGRSAGGAAGRPGRASPRAPQSRHRVESRAMPLIILPDGRPQQCRIRSRRGRGCRRPPLGLDSEIS